MKITNLQVGQKNRDRVHIYIDDEYRGTVYIDFIVKNNVKLNEDITEEKLNSLFQQSHERQLFNLSIRYLSRRSRSEKEIREYMNKKIMTYKMNPLNVNLDTVVAKLYEYKYLNEEEFAVSWTKSRLAKGLGPTRIEMELRQKGIDRNLIDNILYKIDEEDKQNAIEKVSQKFLRNKSFANEREKEWKLKQYLRSKGFN